MNGVATMSTANTSARMLPRIATIALAVTPIGLLMQIIYFFIDFLVAKMGRRRCRSTTLAVEWSSR